MASFPTSVWDGSTPNRVREDDVVTPDPRDFDVLREEVQAVEGYLLDWHVDSLTNDEVKALVQLSLANGAMRAGKLEFVVKATDGTDHQCLKGELRWAAVRKATAVTVGLLQEDDAAAKSTGTLVVVADAVDSGGGVVSVRITATSSLTTTSLNVTWRHEYK